MAEAVAALRIPGHDEDLLHAVGSIECVNGTVRELQRFPALLGSILQHLQFRGLVGNLAALPVNLRRPVVNRAQELIVAPAAGLVQIPYLGRKSS